MNEYQAYLALSDNVAQLQSRLEAAKRGMESIADSINDQIGTRRFECIGGFENISKYLPDAAKQPTVKYIVMVDGRAYQEFEDGTRKEYPGNFTLLGCLAYVHSGMWREVFDDSDINTFKTMENEK